MLYLFLIATAFLLITANLFAYRAKSPGPWIVGLGVIGSFGQFFLGFFLLPWAALLALLLIVALVIWRRSTRGPAFFLALSTGAALLVLGLAGIGAALQERQYERLRALYPYESMEGRVPQLQVSSPPRPLKPDAEARLSVLENGNYYGEIRVWRLKKLHDEKVQMFIDSFGFGFGRMRPEPTEYNLLVHREVVPHQPGPRVTFSTSPGDWMPAKPGEELRLGNLLDKDIIDFANPTVFGYIKDRMHVSGFRPHQMSQAPEGVEDWQVQTLDLVGLLLAREPRVYVSDSLPSMAEVQETPTRPLDKFEAVGLTALRDGDDLWLAREGDAARMLGAIRASNQCITCHGGGRGELLGAFSYTLRQSKAAEGPATKPGS